MMTWGTFDLSRSLLPVGADNAQNQLLMGALQTAMPTLPNIFEMAGDRSLMSLALKGDAKMAVGVNAGIMWDINEQWSLGFTYRSKLRMKVNSGSIALKTIDDPAIGQILGQLLQAPQFSTLQNLSSAVVKTELPLPASLTWGVSFRPTPKWEFAVDLQYVLWSAYDRLDVELVNPTDNTTVMTLASDKNYSNTLAVRIGGQYRVCDFLTARMGMYVDESPVSSDYLNPETPSMTKLAYTVGLTLRPTRWLDIDLAYGYVNSADPERTGSYPYTNSVLELAGVGAAQATTDFSGNYTARAHTFSLGLNFRF